jgi:PTS system cellobiose-specific IIB component
VKLNENDRKEKIKATREGRKTMNNLKILLCCGAGMSSGFLASSARKVIKKKKLNITVEARSHSEAVEFLSSVDVLLLGPHYAKDLPMFQDLATPHGVKVGVIPQDIYGTLDGARLLEFAQSL